MGRALRRMQPHAKTESLIATERNSLRNPELRFELLLRQPDLDPERLVLSTRLAVTSR